MHSELDADGCATVVEGVEEKLPTVSWPVCTGSNHDAGRLATRWAGDDERRARAALMMLLTLRGTPFLYYGDELALPEVPLDPATALDERQGLQRALLLGAGAAIALAVGTWRRWQVPFVTGAIVLALLVLVNVGPPALALPRWVLIASAGALLLTAGITWDDRVRDGRAAIRYVGSMR